MAKTNERQRLGRLGNVPVEICCELGRKELLLKEARALKKDDVIEFDVLAGEAFHIRANGHDFAMGEVVVVADAMAVRVTSLVLNEGVAS